MFQDVYDKPSKEIEKQIKQFKEHIEENKDKYPLSSYDKM